MGYYNRYSLLSIRQEVLMFPDIKLIEKGTDKFEIYEPGKSRFDKLSDQYYSNPYCGWLIMLANPELEGLEFMITSNTPIRIPFPFDVTISEIKDKIDLKRKYYGD